MDDREIYSVDDDMYAWDASPEVTIYFGDSGIPGQWEILELQIVCDLYNMEGGSRHTHILQDDELKTRLDDCRIMVKYP